MTQVDVLTTIATAKRLTNTKSGNPRWELATGAGKYGTEPDAQVGHIDFAALEGKQAIVTLNDSGRVIGIVEPDPERSVQHCREHGHKWEPTEEFNRYICVCGTGYRSTPTGRRYIYPEGYIHPGKGK